MTEVARLEDGEAPAKPSFCLTPTAERVQDALATCQQFGWMGVVVGEPGTGKTTAIEDFAGTMGRRHVRVCRMTRAAARLQPGLVTLASAVGGYVDPNQSSLAISREIERVARDMDNGLFIIDEAQHMDDDLLESVRDIFDGARKEGKFGIVLSGNLSLRARYQNQGNKRRYDNFAQLRGRIGPEIILTRPTAADVEAICAHNGIEGKQSIAIVKKAAGLPGALQKVRNLLEVARELGNGGVSLDDLKAAAAVVGLELK